MRSKFSEGILTKVIFSILLLAATIKASPVLRDDAFRAAASELPGFFAGPWQLTGEFALYNLAGETAAFTFMFARSQPVKTGVLESIIPSEFVAKKRKTLADAGKPISGNESTLYGTEQFASIVISADDTEPVVLRCFQGLPVQEVKQADACALAANKNGAANWHVRQSLMLGLFDEAFWVEKEDGSGALVVDMRSGAVVTHAAAKAAALQKKKAIADDDLIRMCKQAWDKYRVAEKTVVKRTALKKMSGAARIAETPVDAGAEPTPLPLATAKEEKRR